MYLMIDNYDSFVYNLASYFRELGCQLSLVRNDQVSIAEIQKMADRRELEGIIISPGPKSPWESGNCREVVRRMTGRVPILGICLGHQIIGHVHGARIHKGKCPMHGKVTEIFNNGTGLFQNLPESYQVTRYHSLVVEEENLPECLEVDARAGDGAIMAMHHRTAPVYGVQFHPEAVLTEYGHELLGNYLTLSKGWWTRHASYC